MNEFRTPQANIGETLCMLLPLEGAPKTLRELKRQVRLVNDIRHPDDESFGRVILGYLRSPAHTQGIRFHRVDATVHIENPDGLWTRVKIGPSVSSAVSGNVGAKANSRIVQEKLQEVWQFCIESEKRSFYLWDLLEALFDITKDNNSHYRQWLRTLAEALKRDSRFVMIAVDEKSYIPVEWMLAVDRREEVAGTVNARLDEIVDFMRTDGCVIHLTRNLVQRFFRPDGQNEAHDIHTYYQEISSALTKKPEVIQLSIHSGSGHIEGWCLGPTIQDHLRKRIPEICEWMQSLDKALHVEAILSQLLDKVAQLKTIAPLHDLTVEVLKQDPRFLPSRFLDKWEVIPEGPSENASAFRILFETRSPQTGRELAIQARERYPSHCSDFSLDQDERFDKWQEELWALSEWVDVREHAYRLLQESEEPLESKTILDEICQECQIPQHLAIFSPQTDSRFIQTLDGKWRLSYHLQETDLARMLEFLEDGGVGRTLDELVYWTIGLDASGTDAAEILADDSRFILREELWYARERVYRLSENDLDALLGELKKAQTGLRLSTLIQSVLDRDATLTDAHERLEEDGRFRKLLPGVWAAADLSIATGDRKAKRNLSFRSRRFFTFPEEKVADSARTMRPRIRSSTESSSGGPVHITFSLSDIEHGSLRVNDSLGALLESSEGGPIQVIDELDNEFTCWIEPKASLLCGFAPWFDIRDMTYGDRVILNSTSDARLFRIQATGERDQRVYQEAMQRKDLRKVLESARASGKSYHDLIVEVLKHFNKEAGEPVPVHRETIYELVNEIRLAKRNTVFALLSLPQCPYEELRYFVKHGDGYWSYDPDIHRSYEHTVKGMKDTETEAEDSSSRNGNGVSAKSGATDEDEVMGESPKMQQTVEALQSQIDELNSRNQKLMSHKSALGNDIEELCAQKKANTKTIQVLKSTISRLQAELTSQKRGARAVKQALEEEVQQLHHQVSKLRGDLETQLRNYQEIHQQQQEKARELNESKEAISRLRRDIEAVSAANQELKSLNERYRQIISKLKSRAAIQEEQIATTQSEMADLRAEKNSLRESLLHEEEIVRKRTRELRIERHQRAALEESDALLSARLKDATAISDKRRIKIEKLQQSLREANGEMDELRERHNRVVTELEQRARDLSARREESRAIEKNLRRVTEMYQDRTETADQLEKRLEHLQKTLDTRSGRIVNLLSRVLSGVDLRDV